MSTLKPRRRANYYKYGSWNISCQRTGFKIKAEDARREWNNLIVRRQSFETRNAQDFVRGVPDLPGVRLARPRPTLVTTFNTNLVRDRNGSTSDGIYWNLGADWALNSGDGWKISGSAPFLVSSDLVISPKEWIPIGVNEPVLVGEVLYLSGYITLTTWTAGALTGKLKFYEEDRSTVVQTSTAFTVSADAANARASGSVTVPASAAFVQVLMDTGVLAADALEIRNIKLEVGSLTGIGEKVSI